MRPKNKKEGRHQRAGVCLLLTGLMVVGMMALIFAFSAQDASRSSDLSGGLCGRIVRGVLTLLGYGSVFWRPRCGSWHILQSMRCFP